jgi:hypothetical protein
MRTLDPGSNIASRIVGGFSMAFGLLGILCVVTFLSEYRNVSRNFSGMGSGLGPCVVAIVAHLWLLVSGIRLVLRRRVPWLGSFFGIEVIYSFYLLTAAAVAPKAGPVEQAYIRWITDVSLGFFAQLIFGFPLWGWYLVRKW